MSSLSSRIKKMESIMGDKEEVDFLTTEEHARMDELDAIWWERDLTEAEDKEKMKLIWKIVRGKRSLNQPIFEKGLAESLHNAKILKDKRDLRIKQAKEGVLNNVNKD